MKKVLALAMLSLIATGCGLFSARPDAEADAGEGFYKDGPVGRTMRQYHEKFADCGRDSISIQTGQEQNLQLKFRVDPAGKVLKGIWVEKMTGADPDLKVCLIKVLKGIQFPAPSDGQTKLITYPLVLKAGL